MFALQADDRIAFVASPAKIRKAVIPAAGLGTRFLPTTKAVPKELLPILDKPMIQYGVEEVVAGGIDHIILVTSEGKEGLEEFFRPDPDLEQRLADSGATQLLETVRHVSSLARVSTVIQEQQLGLGHAVQIAQTAVGDEPFVVILPDDVIVGDVGVTQQMLEVYEQYGASVVAVQEVPREAVSAYGVVDAEPVGQGVFKVNGLVEKPSPEAAPSNLAVVGRYILTPEIFSCLERTTPGAIGEIQLTDGMALLLEEQPMYALQFKGIRYDGGTPMGLLRASLEVALSREDTRDQAREMLKDL